MNNAAFRELLALLMVCDTTGANHITTGALETFANNESRRRGYTSWVIAYHEFNDDAPEPGSTTPLPGIACKTVVISSTCRKNRTDEGALSEALFEVRAELMRVLAVWPLEKEATFFVCATVDRDGRRELG